MLYQYIIFIRDWVFSSPSMYIMKAYKRRIFVGWLVQMVEPSRMGFVTLKQYPRAVEIAKVGQYMPGINNAVWSVKFLHITPLLKYPTNRILLAQTHPPKVDH